VIGINKSNQTTLIRVFVYYAALVFNIFLGWVLAKINTHYLTVPEYGKYSFFIIFIFLSRSFFSAGVFESTSRLLAVSGSKEGSQKLIGTSLVWAIIFTFPFAIFMFITSFIVNVFFEVKIGDLLYSYAFGAGLILLHTYLILVLRGAGKINFMALATVLPRICYILLIWYLIVNANFTLRTTLDMFFAGFLIALIIGFIYISPRFGQFRSQSKKIFEEVKNYGIHLYVSNVWHEIFFHADKFVVSYFLTEEAMAYYALGYMITFPITHFSTALASTLFRKFSAQNNINSKVIQLNAIFIIISVLVIILLREVIILYLFSDKYAPTILVIIPLALAFGFSGMSKPYSLYLMAKKCGKTVRNISISVSVIHICAGLLIIPVYGIYGAAWLATAVYLLDLTLYVMSYYKVVRKNDTTQS